MSSFKKDLENFEYDSRYVIAEHRWDHLEDEETTKEFYEKKDEQAMSRYKRGRVQSDPETTGQHGTMI